MAVQEIGGLEAAQKLSRRQLSWRAAQEIDEGLYVNLGIGLPTLCTNFIPADREVVLHSENGILGAGPNPPKGEEDKDLINASKEYITLVPGASVFVHSDAFAMIYQKEYNGNPYRHYFQESNEPKKLEKLA